MYKWVEVDLDAIVNNYGQVRKYVREDTKILGVIKADAYGHGLLEVAKELEKQGIDYLAVTEISEGIRLRESGIKIPILVFSPFLPEDIYCLSEYELTVSLANLEMIKQFMTKGVAVKAHIKLETGLGRTGIKIHELQEMVDLLQSAENIEIEGIYSHLATAMWDNTSFALEQYNKFVQAVEFIEKEGLALKIKHICNSAALAKFPQMHLDMVRVGTILYGQEVAGRQVFEGSLQNAWNLKGQITYINELPKGHSIGYERSHVLARDSKTAVIPIGFAHGFSVEPIPRPKGVKDLIKVLVKTVLRFFNHSRVQAYAQIKGQKVPILGKVGMQLTILDITDLSEVQVGDIVYLPGRRTNISPAIPKVFLKNGKPVKVQRVTEKYEEITLAAK